jgi:hypothetical protein
VYTTVVAYFLLIIAQIPTARAPDTAASLTKTEIAQTPIWQAVCLAGKGNGQAYSDATQRLAVFLVSKGITPESEFSTTWKAGPDANSPQTDAEWDVCAESTPVEGIQAPFVFKTVTAQEAAHGQCKARVQDLEDCFTSLIKFATDSGKSPVAPPRYKKLPGDQNTPPTFDVWIPVSSPPATN